MIYSSSAIPLITFMNTFITWRKKIVKKLEERLLEKSKEAFCMAIELYNKPTIRYRIEGFAIFICNAWELMLKAYLIVKEGEDSIYFPDNQKRTISLGSTDIEIFRH